MKGDIVMSVSFRVFGDLHYIDETPNWAEKRKLFEYAEELLDRLIESITNNNDIKLLINLIYDSFNSYK